MEKSADMRGLALEREKIIVKTSIIGITANAVLASFKIAAGLLANSIAVVLDGINNFSDALSSVITIIGAKLAGRKPDKKHPLGHGRIEYISSMLVSAIVLYAGITALIESVKKIFHPEAVSYSALTLTVLAVAIVVKLILGHYVKKKGEQVKSGALTASGSDASFDAVLSASVLVSALIFLKWNFSLEAYVGIAISIAIIKAGLEMLKETLDDILGHRADPEIVNAIRKIIAAEPQVHGVYDILINNYGPDKNYASLHVELDDTLTVAQVDTLTRKIETNVFHNTGVILTGVGIYARNTSDEEVSQIFNKVQKIVMSHNWALQLHGFYINLEEKKLQFDVVLSFETERDTAIQKLISEIQKEYPEFNIQITPDVDITD
ncbi:MAG: cation diffusion facilitator family transporter [Elusimicrobiales bacterium]|nr:cation diffusion facilitator family transporter [Elusimicrobiales bacterium]